MTPGDTPSPRKPRPGENIRTFLKRGLAGRVEFGNRGLIVMALLATGMATSTQHFIYNKMHQPLTAQMRLEPAMMASAASVETATPAALKLPLPMIDIIWLAARVSGSDARNVAPLMTGLVGAIADLRFDDKTVQTGGFYAIERDDWLYGLANFAEKAGLGSVMDGISYNRTTGDAAETRAGALEAAVDLRVNLVEASKLVSVWVDDNVHSFNAFMGRKPSAAEVVVMHVFGFKDATAVALLEQRDPDAKFVAALGSSPKPGWRLDLMMDSKGGWRSVRDVMSDLDRKMTAHMPEAMRSTKSNVAAEVSRMEPEPELAVPGHSL